MMQWLAVAIGGALGACARYSLTLIFIPMPGKWPVATFVANVLGCVLFGVLFSIIVEKALLEPVWRSFFMVGMLGSLTTFSTFAFEAFYFWQQGSPVLAVSYSLVSLVCCISAIAVGYFLTHSIIS